MSANYCSLKLEMFIINYRPILTACCSVILRTSLNFRPLQSFIVIIIVYLLLCSINICFHFSFEIQQSTLMHLSVAFLVIFVRFTLIILLFYHSVSTREFSSRPMSSSYCPFNYNS